MSYSKEGLRRLGRETGEIYAIYGRTDAVNPYAPGSWQNKAFGEGLSGGLEIGKLRRELEEKLAVGKPTGAS